MRVRFALGDFCDRAEIRSCRPLGHAAPEKPAISAAWRVTLVQVSGLGLQVPAETLNSHESLSHHFPECAMLSRCHLASCRRAGAGGVRGQGCQGPRHDHDSLRAIAG